MNRYIQLLTSHLDSGDWVETWYILHLPCPCPKSCWCWKALGSLRSSSGPYSSWWVALLCQCCFLKTLSVNFIICHPHNYKATSWANFFNTSYAHLHCNCLLSLSQAPKRFMWMSMMMVWSHWSLSALKWPRAQNLSGPRITRPSQIPLIWLLSMNMASEYPWCVLFLMESTLCLCSRQLMSPIKNCYFKLAQVPSCIVAPMCALLQVQNHLQQSIPGGFGYILLCGHQHWWHVLQLWTQWRGWVRIPDLASHAPGKVNLIEQL